MNGTSSNYNSDCSIWARYKRLQLKAALPFPICFGLGVLMLVFTRYEIVSEVNAFRLMVVCMFATALVSLRVLRSPCPSCGDLFFKRKDLCNPFASQCLNCGYGYKVPRYLRAAFYCGLTSFLLLPAPFAVLFAIRAMQKNIEKSTYSWVVAACSLVIGLVCSAAGISILVSSALHWRL